jgi:hypothetical protein
LVLFEINGRGNVAGEDAEQIIVIFNATSSVKEIDLASHDIVEGEWSVYIDDCKAGTTALYTVTDGKVTVAPISALVIAR